MTKKPEAYLVAKRAQPYCWTRDSTFKLSYLHPDRINRINWGLVRFDPRIERWDSGCFHAYKRIGIDQTGTRYERC